MLGYNAYVIQFKLLHKSLGNVWMKHSSIYNHNLFRNIIKRFRAPTVFPHPIYEVLCIGQQVKNLY